MRVKIMDNKTVAERLFELQDTKYRDFNAKLIPTVDHNRIIGIRTPQLKKFAKDFAKENAARDFIKKLPHFYYEENNLHAFLIAQIKDIDLVITELNRFLPFVDNWGTCDSMRPKVLGKYPEKLLISINQWIKDKHPYTVRFGIGMLMAHFLDENFSPEYLWIVAEIQSDEYYVNMMRAWYFATALAKQYKSVIPFFESPKLDKWTHNKSIQKAIESYRITPEQKEYLKSLKI